MQDILRWNLRADLSVFPTTSSSYAVTVQYSSGPYALGDAIFALTAVESEFFLSLTHSFTQNERRRTGSLMREKGSLPLG